MIDKQTKMEIMATVRRAMQEALEASQEVWVTGDTLGKHIEAFTPAWLKRYGRTLNRTRPIVTEADGSEHQSPWLYPLHATLRMVAENRVKELRLG